MIKLIKAFPSYNYKFAVLLDKQNRQTIRVQKCINLIKVQTKLINVNKNIKRQTIIAKYLDEKD
jgi:hypothetical protein